MNLRTTAIASAVLFSALAASSSRSQSFFDPSVALALDGTCAVTYHAAPSEGGRVFLSLLDRDDRAIDSSCAVNAGLSGYGQNPAVACDGEGRFTLVWEQWTGGGSSIYRAQYGASGTRLSGALPECVADSASISAQTPRIAAAADGRAIVVWLDYRLGHPAVYAQRYTKDGKKEGRNVRIDDDRAGTMIQTPSVCIDERRNALGVIWQETIRDSFRVVFARTKWEMKKPKRAAIDRSRGQAYASTPDAAALSTGADAYWAVWKDYRTGESNIFAQRIPAGAAMAVAPAARDSNLKVNDDTTKNWQRLPRIASSPKGMVAVWEDYRNDSRDQIGDIYAQKFDAKGRRTGSNFKVHDAPEPSVQRFPAVAMNALGEFAVVWSDSREGRTDVYLRRGSLGSEEAMHGADRRIAP